MRRTAVLSGQADERLAAGRKQVRYVPLTINLGQENIEEVEILCIIVKHLLGLLMNENKWMRLYYSVKHYLFLWMLMFAAIFAYF